MGNDSEGYDTYKGLKVPNLAPLVASGKNLLSTGERGNCIIIEFLAISEDVCYFISCHECIANVRDNSIDTCLEYLLLKGYITKEEALDYTLSRKSKK